MKLTYKYQIKPSKEILNLCSISKCLYNQALYEIKNSLKENNKFIFYYDLNKIMKTKPNIEGLVNYKLLKSQVSQQILMNLDKNIKSYIKSIKDWSKNRSKNRSKYKGKPKLPNYKSKYNNLIYTNQSCKIKNQFIFLNKNIKIHIPQWKEEFKKFNQIKIIPKHNYIEVYIIYNKDCINENLNSNKYASIDLGVNNFVTLVSENKPILINGKQIKSLNKFYNKRKSYCCSIKDKMKIKKYTNKLYDIERKRNNQLNDVMHQTSRFIINYLLKNKIGTLVVGYNKSWKDSIKLGNKNNQIFVSIPYFKLIKFLEYKCQLVGIKFKIITEEYTSKCDSISLEPIQKQINYLGKRVKRGLFQSDRGKLINADINGALNILRKVVDDSYTNKIINRGLLFNPVKIRNIYCLNSLQKNYLNNL
jgi:putative transposase